jgi:hypothetical protein
MLNNFIDLVNRTDEFHIREVVPCTVEDIINLQMVHPLQLPLPLCFVEFLKFGGRKIADWNPASGFYYDSFIYHNSQIKNTFFSEKFNNQFFKSNYFDKFPQEIFLFLCNEGYQYEFFRLDEGDDPPTYFVEKGDSIKKLKPSTPSISERLLQLYRPYLDFHIKRIGDRKILQKKINFFKNSLFDILDQIYVNKDLKNEDIANSIWLYESITNNVYDIYSDKEAALEIRRKINIANCLFEDIGEGVNYKLIRPLKELEIFYVNNILNEL